MQEAGFSTVSFNKKHTNPISYARHLAESPADKSASPFFAQMYTGADNEYMQTALCKALVSSTIRDMHNFEQELKDEIKRTGSQYLGCDGKESYIKHADRVLCSMMELFIGSPDILNRIAEALEDCSPNVFYSMGTYYSIFWYGISGTFLHDATVYAMNCLHDEMIDNMTSSIQTDCTEEDRKSKIVSLCIFLALSIILNLILLFN